MPLYSSPEVSDRSEFLGELPSMPFVCSPDSSRSMAIGRGSELAISRGLTILRARQAGSVGDGPRQV